RTLACISNPIGGEYISTGVFGGVPLTDLLMRAGLDADTSEVRFTCADGYTESLPLAAALDPTTLVAVTLDGQPLARQHGFPARLVLAGRYGMKQPKWLTAIRPVTEPYDGYWEVRGWNKDAFVRTFSRMDRPTEGETVGAGVLVDVGGVAYAGSRGVKGVQLSFDGREHRAAVPSACPSGARRHAHALLVLHRGRLVVEREPLVRERDRARRGGCRRQGGTVRAPLRPAQRRGRRRQARHERRRRER